MLQTTPLSLSFFFFWTVPGLSCSMWDLVSYQGSNLGLLHWKHGSLSHWITGQVPLKPVLWPTLCTPTPQPLHCTSYLPPGHHWFVLCICEFAFFPQLQSLICYIFQTVFALLHLAQCPPRPSMLLQMAKFHFFHCQSITLCVCVCVCVCEYTSSLSIRLLMDTQVAYISWQLSILLV